MNYYNQPIKHGIFISYVHEDSHEPHHNRLTDVLPQKMSLHSTHIPLENCIKKVVHCQLIALVMCGILDNFYKS